MLIQHSPIDSLQQGNLLLSPGLGLLTPPCSYWYFSISLKTRSRLYGSNLENTGASSPASRLGSAAGTWRPAAGRLDMDLPAGLPRAVFACRAAAGSARSPLSSDFATVARPECSECSRRSSALSSKFGEERPPCSWNRLPYDLEATTTGSLRGSCFSMLSSSSHGRWPVITSRSAPAEFAPHMAALCVIRAGRLILPTNWPGLQAAPSALLRAEAPVESCGSAAERPKAEGAGCGVQPV
mmetsp:Transcript_34902/g.89298  ORF Transcript_34902/g.89298 Transcript_34902/m.89298 type:complete len:240 (+) Transcript_34902:130-849(+)